MSEKFTWECIQQTSCDDCIVAKFKNEHALTDEQQLVMLQTAYVADIMLEHNKRETVIEELGQIPHPRMPEYAVQVAVDGVIQWASKGCRAIIRAELAS